MICFPNAKINLGLHVTGKREDGYHNIETIFYPVSLSDILDVIPLPEGGPRHNTFAGTGRKLDTDHTSNLCIRAWTELGKIRPLPNISVHLHKIIPVGAGLGGGSSDAAFMLMALNDLFSLDMSLDELAEVAGCIGSDSPFFIHNEPLYATGRGNVFEAAEIDLSGYIAVIVYPGIHIDTSHAYGMVRVRNHGGSLRELIMTDPSRWQRRVVNDFEQVVCEIYPLINDVREKLTGSGAFYVSMTGSGSAVYGLFDQGSYTGISMEEFPGMFVWQGVLQ